MKIILLICFIVFQCTLKAQEIKKSELYLLSILFYYSDSNAFVSKYFIVNGKIYDDECLNTFRLCNKKMRPSPNNCIYKFKDSINYSLKFPILSFGSNDNLFEQKYKYKLVKLNAYFEIIENCNNVFENVLKDITAKQEKLFLTDIDIHSLTPAILPKKIRKKIIKNKLKILKYKYNFII